MSTSILAAVREEIQRTRHRLEQLQQVEQLAIDLVGDLVVDAAASAAGARTATQRQKPPAAEAPTRAARKPARRQLTVAEVLDGIRDALADGPRTVNTLHAELGITSRTAHSGRVFEEALAQLGASEAGKYRGGVLYVLNGNSNGNGEAAATATLEPPAPAAPAAEEVDIAYLERRLVRLLGSGPRTADAAAEAIDAPVDAVRDACDRLTESGDLSRLTDGTYVA